LFLSRWFPWPPDNGSKLRIYSLLRGLSERHDVTLLSFVENRAEENDIAEMRSLCSDVLTVRRKTFTPNSWRSLAGFFNPAPRSVVATFSQDMVRLIQNALAERSYDLVIASQDDTAAYAAYFDGLPALFEEMEVGFLHDRFVGASTVWRRFRHRLTWIKHRNYLARLLRHFRAYTAVSGVELGLISQAVPDAPQGEIMPNCVNLGDYAGFKGTEKIRRLIFTGSFSYHPNHEAMIWFLRHAYPGIRKQLPRVPLMITGDHGNLPLPPAEEVELTGWVDDVRPLIASSSVSLAPIHSGGGTRLKILEAMALGTPVVATSKGAEGLEVESGRHLLIADSPPEYAEAVVKILENPGLSQRLQENALELVTERYDWGAVMPRFLALVERVGGNSGAARHGNMPSASGGAR